MTHYLSAFGWGLVLLLASTGWGLFFGRRVLRLREFGPGAGPATGIALAVAVGGVLNLLAWISSTLIDVWVVTGLIFAVAELPRKTGRADQPGRWTPLSRWAALGVAAFVLLRYAGSVQPVQLNEFDDMTGYLVFPVRMLDTGEIGRDPFNARRLESALGGMSFLHAMMMAHFPEQNAPLVDLGVGLLAAALAATELALSRRLAGTMLIPLVLMVAYDPTPLTNITAVLTGVALMIALCQAVEREGTVWSRAVLVAVIASALCSIKSSYIPITVLFLGFHYAGVLVRRRSALEGLIVLGLTTAAMLPWMIALDRSSGTLLFPLLGKGFHGSVHGTFTPSSAGLGGRAYLKNLVVGFTDPVALAAWVGAGSSVYLMARSRRGSAAAIAFQVATVLDTLVLLRMFEFVDALRYLAPVYTVSLVLSLTEILVFYQAEKAESHPARLAGLLTTAGFVLAFALGVSWWPARSLLFKPMVRNAISGLKGYHFTSSEEVAELRRAQAAIPPGEPFIVWVTKPYLLDFRRNPIYVLDWPGVASPPPGLPVNQSAEAMADYLIQQKIRYFLLAPSIRTLYPATEADVERMTSGWSRAVSLLAIRFHQQLDTLLKSRLHLHQSSGLIVLDLATAHETK